VTGEWEEGAVRPMGLYDPASEIHAPVLDGRANGTEVLQYDLPGDSPPGQVHAICVDVSRVATSKDAAPPICLSRKGSPAKDDTIVGHQAFDAETWRRPASAHMSVELGLGMNYVDLSSTTWTVYTATGGESVQIDASRLKRAATFVMDLRFFPWLKGPFYFGGMFEAGGGGLDTNVTLSANGVPVRSDNGFVDLSVGAVAGVGVGITRLLRVRADVTAGVRVLDDTLTPPACSSSTCAWDAWVARPLVSPRLAFDAWFSPWWTFVAWAQADALYLPDCGLGLSLAFHPWAYDGVP
jgi:hypothetical protein